jgi:hypothetical protein
MDRYNERTSLSMEQLGRMFVKYCWWKTLAPLVFDQRRLPARRVRLVKELFDAQHGVDDIIEVQVEQKGDETPLEADEPGDTRLHVQWHGTVAADLVRSAPWPWHENMSPERRWFEALYKMVPGGYRKNFVSKPMSDMPGRKINLPTENDADDKLKQASKNVKWREQWREFLEVADKDRSLLRTGADQLPWPFSVRQVEHIVSHDDIFFERYHEQFSPEHWPGPGPDALPGSTPTLAMRTDDQYGIIFEGWFDKVVVVVAEDDDDKEFPRRFAEGLDNKDMQEFWSCFLVPLACGFAEEYIV